MEPHVKKEAEGYDYCMKCYVEGQGTFDLGKDSVRGYAFGGGASGVAGRAIEGIERAVSLVVGKREIKPAEFYIKKLTIDVFGFSRGAATARYAIHVLFNGVIGHVDQYSGQVYYDCDPIHSLLSNRGYDIDPKAVGVCFAGLYDTVLSYYGSQIFPFSNNVLQQRAVARAKKALHLAAADEHRDDFPLHNIKSAKCNGGEEYYLPGVHSDVGGSYNKASEKELEAESDESKKDYMLTSGEKHIILKGQRNMLMTDRKYLMRQGWYKENEIWVEPRELLPMSPATMHQTLNNQLHVDRQDIRSAYCNIPLKIMAEYARKPDVNLKINSKLEDRADIILELEADLQKLEGIIKDYIANTSESKANDWIGEQAPLNTKELRDIRNKHFHFSSKPGMGYKPRMVRDRETREKRRIRYVYDA